MITVLELSVVRPELPRKDQSIYVNRVRNHWCPFAKGQGKCDLKCSANAYCSPVIARATDLADARVPVALLVYKLREERKKAERNLLKNAETPRITVGVSDLSSAFAELTTRISV